MANRCKISNSSEILDRSKFKTIENPKSNIEIYKTVDGKTEIEVNLENETVWLTIEQMADLFQKAKSTINEHILNIYKEEELPKEQSLRKIGISDFSTKPTNFYNLDTIISVGYRVKSKRGTQFRIWANKVLRDHLVKGYSINKNRLEQTEQELKFLRTGIQIVSRAIEKKASEKGFEYLNQFAKGLTLLDDYDHENLDSKGLTKRKAVYPKQKEYEALIEQMKAEFDSYIFGLEKDQSFKSAVAQITKGFGKTGFYPSLEEKQRPFYILWLKTMLLPMEIKE